MEKNHRAGVDGQEGTEGKTGFGGSENNGKFNNGIILTRWETLLRKEVNPDTTEHKGFPCGSAVENPSATQEVVQETQVQSLGREDPQEGA